MEVLKILIINLLFFSFLVFALCAKHSKYKHISVILVLIFPLGCFIIYEKKESAIYEAQSKHINKIESDSIKDLNESIFFEKCNYFKENHKGLLSLANLVCSTEKGNKIISYKFIANSPVTVLVRDDFAYKYTDFQNKKRLVLLNVLKYSFFSLIPEFRDSINKKINEHVTGVTYLEIVEQMPLFYKYESFGQCEAFNCGIAFEVVPGNQLPEGKFYVVKPYSEGVK
ncbi:hypothetical protein [Enterobacter cloacae complex sp. 418I7]|uniref:hypothetical protein n=1 Tax=Enterobacter cloacae complex sp. 418I7 TaxID=3395839 RepID=UPI003CEC69C2